MVFLNRNFKQLVILLVVSFVVVMGYVLAAKEAKAHRGAWQLSQRFATCEDLVNYLNIEGIHEDFIVVPDSGGGYRVIFED